MDRIVDIFSKKKQTFSFELFPPKTDQGYQNLLQTIKELSLLNPDFISCTYGAGGGSKDKTFDIVQLLEKEYNIPGLAHLTCVLHTKDEMLTILKNLQSRHIGNILALRGDPPKDNPHWQPTENQFQYSSELCAFIRAQFGSYFSIGVAGFPEGHVLCPDRNKDAQFLKMKIDAGANFVITQLFFDNQDYFKYVERLKNLNVSARIIPGILPITDYNALVKFCGLCGAKITDEIHEIFKPIANDKEKTLAAGIEFAIKQCKELLRRGAPGLHFYCLNKVSPTDKILNAIR